MGDKIEARGPREEGPQAHSGIMLHAGIAITRPANASYPRSQRSQDVYAKSVKIFKDAAAILRQPASDRSRCRTPAPACRRCWCILIRRGRIEARALHGVLRRLRRHQGAATGYGIPELAARGIGCLIVVGPAMARACASAICR
jgi:hypothetical protein